ncbi:LysR family transcriptional regulator [Actinocorallia populi]|uniref:LysR family transcriptional regulator n=1 Tax=Actinocorallia populi TaxID=2079200 RepID=UPI0018E535BA|nr:LysR family transcriptional regulator [Actinocorallia populi]
MFLLGSIGISDSCDPMELRHLEYFAAVAEELNFTRAARRLHIAQSGLSAAIRSLERELGLPLFERTSKRVALTDAGIALLPEARTTLAAARAARDAVDEVRGGLRGSLTIGTLASLGILDLPALVGRFHADHPGVAISLQVAARGSADLARSLLEGALDAAFLSLPGAPPPGLDRRLLASLPLLAVLPAGHPLAGRDGVAPADLADESFIDSPVGYGNRTLVDRYMAASNVHRTVRIEVHDVSAAADFVRHGLGVTIVPSYAAPHGDPRLAVLPLADPAPRWELFIATPSHHRPSTALRALLRLVDAHVHVP